MYVGEVVKHKFLNVIKLCLPVPPPLNKRLIPINGRLIKSKSSRVFANDCHFIFSSAHSIFSKKPIYKSEDLFVNIEWYRERKIGDIDGRLKSLFDCMEGFVYSNDKQIKKMTVHIVDKDPKSPRMELAIMPLFTDMDGQWNIL